MSNLFLLTLPLITLCQINCYMAEKPDFVIVETATQLPPLLPVQPDTGPDNGQPPLRSPEGPLEPYDIIVHLHRSRRFLLTGAKNDGKLLVKLFPSESGSRNGENYNQEQVFELDLTTTRLKTLTKQVMLNPEILVDEEVDNGGRQSRSNERERLSRSRIEPVVSVIYAGDGQGSLEIRRVSFIPSGGSRRLENIKKSKCAKFDDNNLLESRMGIQKILTHKDCQSRLIARG